MNTEQWAWQFSPAGLLTVRWDNIWIKIPSALTLIAPLCRICYVDDGDAWCRLAWWNLDIMIWHYALASDRVWRRESWAGVWRVSPCSLTGDSTQPPPSPAPALGNFSYVHTCCCCCCWHKYFDWHTFTFCLIQKSGCKLVILTLQSTNLHSDVSWLTVGSHLSSIKLA